MEFDAGNPLLIAVVAIQISSWQQSRGVDLSSLSSLCISEHFKVILEDIDNFIGLQSCFNLKGHTVYELIELLLLLFGLLLILFRDLDLLLFLFLEISWIVHGRLVN